MPTENVIEYHGNLQLKGRLMLDDEDTDFPENPERGWTSFRSGILYLYTDVEGIMTWYPLTKPRSVYVHNQGQASLQWDIPHGLATEDLVISMIDSNKKLIMLASEVQIVDDGNVRISFATPMAGKAIVFGDFSSDGSRFTVIDGGSF